MKLRLLALGVLAATIPAAARAQNAQCANPGIVGPGLEGGDACQKAVDFFAYLNPQFGSTIAGGNAILGQSGAQGGFGRFTLEVRANALRGSVPNADAATISDGQAQSTAFTVEDQPIAFPSADGALGLFGGIPLGISKVLSVDALASLTYIPEVSTNDVSVTLPDGSLKFGYGARLGILQQNGIIPNVSATWIKRDLPSVSVSAAATGSDTISVSNFSVKTTSWRLVAGWNLKIISLAAGYGQDEYKSAADLSYVLHHTQTIRPVSPIHMASSPKATSMFADVMVNLWLVKLVGEVGQVKTDDVATFNTFSKPASDAKTYAAVGLRFGH